MPSHPGPPLTLPSQVWLEQADAHVVSEGEEVTLMDWGNAIIKVRWFVRLCLTLRVCCRCGRRVLCGARTFACLAFVASVSVMCESMGDGPWTHTACCTACVRDV
jgi:hypothetical protein